MHDVLMVNPSGSFGQIDLMVQLKLNKEITNLIHISSKCSVAIASRLTFLLTSVNEARYNYQIISYKYVISDILSLMPVELSNNNNSYNDNLENFFIAFEDVILESFNVFDWCTTSVIVC